jgi:hypothetical protein
MESTASKVIFQLSLLVASLFAAITTSQRWLKAYLIMASGLALIELIDLNSGFGIDSYMYGIMWSLFNFAMLSFASLYAHLQLRYVWAAVAIAVIISHPNRWYLYMTAAKGIWCLIIGVALLSYCFGTPAKIMGGYFIAAAAWRFAFTRFDGAQWNANLWLPSLLSISAYSAVAISQWRKSWSNAYSPLVD